MYLSGKAFRRILFRVVLRLSLMGLEVAIPTHQRPMVKLLIMYGRKLAVPMLLRALKLTFPL